MGETLIIGAVDRYNYDDIKYWLNSIKKNAPSCKTALIVYNMDNREADKLIENGLDFIFAFGKNNQGDLEFDTTKNFNIVVDRFAHLWHFLSEIPDFDHVVCTDVKDVIFQWDPNQWMNDYEEIIVGAEYLKYCDEPWNRNNMVQSFGEKLYTKVFNKPIYCAGVIAGKRQSVADFCLNIFLLCHGRQRYIDGGGGPDQAALNILLSMETHRECIWLTSPSGILVAHLGTSRQAILSHSGGIGHAYKMNPQVLDAYDQNVLWKQYILKDKICNHNGEPYCIVHQWDRCNDIAEYVRNTYA